MDDPRVAKYRAQRQEERSGIMWRRCREALTGRVGASNSDSPYSGLPDGMIWVHSSEDGPSEVPALNPGVITGRTSNARVFIAELKFTGELYVIGLEGRLNSIAFGGAIGALAQPDVPAELQPFGAKAKEFTPTVLPPDDPQAGGLYLYVNAGWYGDGKWWGGGRILLVPTATSSKKAWVVVGFDETAGALVQALGTDYGLPVSPLPRTDVATTFAGSTFANARPIAAVVLANGATSFTQNDIIDIRDLSATGGAGSSSTDINYLVDQDFYSLKDQAGYLLLGQG